VHAAVQGLSEGSRCFSTSPSDEQPPPPLERGLQGLYSLYKRCAGRLDRFEAYSEGGVFTPDMNAVQQMLVFIQLQLPARTQVDVIDFLAGARVAAQRQFEAINSLDLPKFLAGELDESASADRLQAFCTPGYYNLAALQVKRNYKQRACMIECQGMTVEQAHLRFVDYHRLTEQQYTDEVAFMKPPPTSWPLDATIERLRLHVDLSTVEDLCIHFLDKDEQRLVQQQNVHRVVFESRVTTPDEVDWRIGNVLRLENRSIEHPPAKTPPVNE
jgi:hypothetical protein